MNAILLFLLGFGLLYFGGELLVKGSVALALRLRISTLVVGMTIVSFATSAPELFVSLQASLKGYPNITLGNVIGSNIVNVALVLGLAAFLFRFKLTSQIRKTSYPVMLASSIILGFILYSFKSISTSVGFVFIALLILFGTLLIRQSRKDYLKADIDNDSLLEQERLMSIYKSILYLLVGLILLKLGADYFVDGAVILAKIFKISDRIIAITIVAVGTSIPELATTVVATIKKEENLAVGNLIGSNIFNILAVLGFTAIIQDIPLLELDEKLFRLDYTFMMISTLLLGLFIYVFSKKQISRLEGSFLLLVYISYILFIFYPC